MKKALVIVLILSALAIPTVSSAGWLRIIGTILSDTTGNRSDRIADCLKGEASKELAYKAIETFLENRNVPGANYFVEAIKTSVEKDYSEAAITFKMGLDESGLKLEAAVELLNLAAVTVRTVSPEVADKVEGLTQYVSNR